MIFFSQRPISMKMEIHRIVQQMDLKSWYKTMDRHHWLVNEVKRKTLSEMCLHFFVFVVEFYNKSQGIVLLQVYDRSMSQNSCARTDIILKRGSRTRKKQPTNSSSTTNDEKVEMPSLPSSSSTAGALLGIKTEERNLSVNQRYFFFYPHRLNDPFFFFEEITVSFGQRTTTSSFIGSTTPVSIFKSSWFIDDAKTNATFSYASIVFLNWWSKTTRKCPSTTIEFWDVTFWSVTSW